MTGVLFDCYEVSVSYDSLRGVDLLVRLKHFHDGLCDTLVENSDGCGYN